MRKFGFFVALATVLWVAQGAFAISLPPFTDLRIIAAGRTDAALYDFDVPPGGTVPYTAVGAAAVDAKSIKVPFAGFATRLGGGGAEDAWGVFEVSVIEDFVTGTDYFGGTAGTGGKEVIGVFYDLQDIYVRTVDLLAAGVTTEPETLEHIDSEGGYVIFYEQPAGTFAAAGGFSQSPTARTGRTTFPGIGGVGSTVLWTTRFTDAGFLHTKGGVTDGGIPTSLDDSLMIARAGHTTAVFGEILAGSSSKSALSMDTIPTTGPPAGGFTTGVQNNLVEVGAITRNGVLADMTGTPGSTKTKGGTPFGTPGITVSDPPVIAAAKNWTTAFTGTFAFTSTPEPSSIVLIGMGLIGLAAAMRKRRAK